MSGVCAFIHRTYYFTYPTRSLLHSSLHADRTYIRILQLQYAPISSGRGGGAVLHTLMWLTAPHALLLIRVLMSSSFLGHHRVCFVHQPSYLCGWFLSFPADFGGCLARCCVLALPLSVHQYPWVCPDLHSVRFRICVLVRFLPFGWAFTRCVFSGPYRILGLCGPGSIRICY